MSEANLTRLDEVAIPTRRDEIRCLATIRNEALPDVGASRFSLANPLFGSSDGYTVGVCLMIGVAIEVAAYRQGRDRPKPSPTLQKDPIGEVANRPGLRSIGALLPFKFFADLYSNAEKETERKEHWDSAAQYAAYWHVLNENSALSAFFEESVQYENSMQLVELGLLRVSAEYARFVDSAP